MARFISLYGRQERKLALSSAPAFSRQFTAQVGVIDLDAPGERLSMVALVHGLHQLVFELPGRVVGDAEAPRQLQRRDADLELGQQIDRQE